MKAKYLMSSVICLLLFFPPALLFSQNIFRMAKEGNIEEIKYQLSLNNNILACVDESNYTLLHWALIREKWDLAGFLMDVGADLNIQGSEGGTPLHCAANHDNPDIIKRLIEEGAKPDVPNLWGNTPLSLASQRGCTRTAKVLINAGSDINYQSAEGWTPLHYAFKSGHADIQRLLLDAGASDTIKDKYGRRPCDYSFTRPTLRIMDPEKYQEYEGLYFIAPGSFFRVQKINEKLFLEDFALDEIYPIARDQFYDYREPWKIRFFRDREGEVDQIAVDFQRQTVIGKRVASENDTPVRPGLGIATRPVNPEDIPFEIMKTLFFDMKGNGNAPLVTLVGENTPSARAGIQVNDIILELNNEPLLQPGDLVRILNNLGSEKKVPIKVLRGTTTLYRIIEFPAAD